MDTSQKELSLEESIKEVMQTLPPVVRSYLAQGKYTPIAKSLMAKYNLRIDQGGVLEREIMLLLMGVENPNEFTQTLAEEAHLDEQTISSIVQEVNDKIFVPLRAEEERGSQGGKVASVSRPSQPTVPEVRPSSTLPKVEPQTQQMPGRSQVPANPSIAPLPPKMVMPRPGAGATLGDVIRSVLPPEVPAIDSVNRIQPRTEGPRPEYRIPTPPAPPAPTPTNLPGMMPGNEPPATLEFRRVEPHAATIAAQPAPTPLTFYSSSDPYREPVDEPPTK